MLRVIYNPVAGPKAVRRIDAVREVLGRRNDRFEIVETRAPGDATALAAEAARAGCDAVVAMGGDGTVNEAANGLAGSATRLLVIPHGTGNVFALEVGLPRTIEGCLALLDDGRTVPIRLAKANGRYFVLMASAGFDAEVVERTPSLGKNLFGILAYGAAGARHLFRRQPMLWLEFPGRERVEAQLVVVCRGRTYGRATLNPGGALSGDTLHLVALRRPGRLAILRFAFRAFRGAPLSPPDVLVRDAGTVLVRSSIPSAAQVDGDYLGPLPVRFEMTDATLRIVVPRGYAHGSFPADGVSR